MTPLPRVVDKVLGKPGEALVRQTELVGEPAGEVAPEGERHQVDVHEPERGDERCDADDETADARAFRLREVEAAAEEVRADRQEVVARRVQHAPVRRAAAEPRLRQHAVEDHERAEEEREPVGHTQVEPAPPVDEDERHDEQHVLPRGDHRQRAAAHTRAPERRQHEVVYRQAGDERVERPHGPSHAGPTAMSVMPLLSTRTL